MMQLLGDEYSTNLFRSHLEQVLVSYRLYTPCQNVAHLAFGGMTVEARLGCTIAPALAVVHVDREVEVEEVALEDMRLC